MQPFPNGGAGRSRAVRQGEFSAMPPCCHTAGAGGGTVEEGGADEKQKLLFRENKKITGRLVPSKRDGTVTKPILDDDLMDQILAAVGEIPVGRVATYGQIARLIGREKNARLVGKALGRASYYGSYPCHRVVNHAGRLVPGWQEQRSLLEQEGVILKDSHHVDLKRHRWECE